VIRFLLGLYPREWRRRYGAEMLAHFGRERIHLRDALDLLSGALDAHLHPHWRHRGRRRPRVAAALALLAATALLAGVTGRAVGLVLVAAAAAILGLVTVAVRRRQRRHGWRWDPDDPAAGARMPRRPYDPDPEPLEAVGQVRR
jgi:Flp pilus assembly protein TadB